MSATATTAAYFAITRTSLKFAPVQQVNSSLSPFPPAFLHVLGLPQISIFCFCVNTIFRSYFHIWVLSAFVDAAPKKCSNVLWSSSEVEA